MGNTIEGSVSGGSAVVTWQDKLKQYAVAAVESERPTGQFFSIKSGVLTFGGVAVPNNTMDVVVLASIHENVLYAARYDPDHITGPKCYAYGTTDPDQMHPHAEAAEPQSPEGCKVCPHNKFGSDPKGGKGKACKNVRRLALMAASSLQNPSAVQGATVGYLRVPVTSVVNYQRFVASVAARQLPPFGVVCRVTVKPDAKTQVRVEFDPIQIIQDQAALQAVLERHEVERKLIDFPYASGPDDEAAAKPSHAVPPTVPQPPAAPSKF